MTNTDQPTQCRTPPDKVLEQHETEKKEKYHKACAAQQQAFTPFVFSVNNLHRKETSAAVKQLASHLASKWSHHYSEV